MVQSSQNARLITMVTNIPSWARRCTFVVHSLPKNAALALALLSSLVSWFFSSDSSSGSPVPFLSLLPLETCLVLMLCRVRHCFS